MSDAAQIRAQKSADAMWAGDAASQNMGMRIENIAPGKAVLSLRVQQEHSNGHGICHGGIIFSLADSAFAFACNSYNEQVVGQHATISYIRPAKIGDTLIATALELSKTGRSGIYDVTVTRKDGETIAEFRGFSRVVPGQHFSE
ncbi:hydroxyphenylacetyl-CoA thioesterase PaaI [Polycladidibacter hongkongensis]|uniref:hydroxyphenylacetyl-CoA thioesterase PaaI n=1 Tax=Polycladidibacter hongkongensis TaxID=1647556 RepID=UPI000837A922|nr:hydroxyphenylacetyl-CoA thioesterase PaaI [Pseudovibrio hongkongensis]